MTRRRVAHLSSSLSHPERHISGSPYTEVLVALQHYICGAYLGALVFAGLGCGPQPGYVERQWAGTMRELGIVPLFPPRADVFVGDVYASSYDPESNASVKSFEAGNSSIGMNPRWYYIDLRGLMNTEYKKRPLGAPTPAQYTQLLDNPATMPAQEPTTQNVLGDNSPQQGYRVVGFPEFTSVTFTQGNLSALVPTEAISVAFGAAASKFDSVSVKLPSAESIGVDTNAALAKLVIPDGHGNSILVPEVFNYLDSQQDAHTHLVYVRLVTEVFYARVVDITATTSATGGGTATFKPVVSGNSTQGGSAPTTQPTTAPAIIDPNASPVARAQALNASLAATGAQTFPGGSISFVSASDQSISLRRVYTRPVAFGFRGVTLTVDARNGHVLKIDVSHTKVPAIE